MIYYSDKITIFVVVQHLTQNISLIFFRWVVLCLAWFLAANRKWGAESIAGLAPYFHAACWGIPALLSVVVLVTNSIDGDVFTGKRCFICACSVMLI